MILFQLIQIRVIVALFLTLLLIQTTQQQQPGKDTEGFVWRFNSIDAPVSLGKETFNTKKKIVAKIIF